MQSGFGYDVKSDVLNAMRAGVTFRFPVRIREFTMQLRPLSMHETLEVHQFVAQEMAAMPPAARTKVMEHSLMAKQTIIMATTSQPGAEDPRMTHLEMKHWLPDEIHAVYKEYLAIVDKVNPSPETMDPKEVAALVDEVKKSPREDLEYLLTAYSFLQLKAIICSLMSAG